MDEETKLRFSENLARLSSKNNEDVVVDLSNKKLFSETPKKKKIGPIEAQVLSYILIQPNFCKEINLYCNNIGSEGTKVLCEVLYTHKYLKKFILYFNDIGDEGAKCVATLIEKNNVIEEIDLRRNNIRNLGAESLYKAISNNPSSSLSILELYLNPITNEELKNQIQNKLHEYRDLKLETLKFEKIQITKEHWDQALTNKDFIKVFRARSCNLTELPVQVYSFTNLAVLDLNGNNLTEVPDLTNLSHLVTLHLTNNKIVIPLPLDSPKFSDFWQLCAINWKLPSSLKHIFLSGNPNTQSSSQNFINHALPYICYESLFHKYYTEVFANAIEMSSNNSADIYKPPLYDVIRRAAVIILWTGFVNNEFIQDYFERIQALIKTGKVNLSNNNFYHLPDEIKNIFIPDINEKEFHSLFLNGNHFDSVPIELLALSRLKKLMLQNCALVSIPPEISKLVSLVELGLEGNKLEEVPKELASLSNLQKLWLDRNMISKIPSFVLEKLEKFSANENKLYEIVTITDWSLLEILFLDGNGLRALPSSIKNFANLKNLHLNNNKLSFLPEEIGMLTKLQIFEIKDNQLEQLPSTIGELVHLKCLHISNNQLKELPASMAFLRHLNTVLLKGNPFQSSFAKYVDNWNEMQAFLTDLLNGGDKCNFVKMIIIGEENVGKTNLVDVLVSRNRTRTHSSPIHNSSISSPSQIRHLSNFGLDLSPSNEHSIPSNLATDGIEISLKGLKIKVNEKGLENLIFNIWDFGGQLVYYSTHSLFLSESSIFVVVWKMNVPSGIERMAYWLNTIRALTKNPSIIIVGTHLDEFNDPKKVSDLCNDVSNKMNVPRENILPLSNLTLEGIETFIKKLKQEALLLPSVGETFPKMYTNLHAKMEEEAKKRPIPVIEWGELKKIAQGCQVVGDSELNRAVSYLHTLGFCLHFPKDEFLKGYVVLTPQWLAKAIATLVSVKSEFIIRRDGILDHKQLSTVWKEYPKNIHKLILKLMESFYIAVPISNLREGGSAEESIIPALLFNRKKDEDFMSDWVFQENKLKRIYEFKPIFPYDFFPRLIATLLLAFGVERSRFWKDGICIVRNDASALVIMDNEVNTVKTIYAGRYWFPLFQKIRFTIEMLLYKWENLEVNVQIVCPSCACKSNFIESNDYCFTWKECFQRSIREEKIVQCNKSKARKMIKIIDLLPELSKKDLIKLEEDQLPLQGKIGDGASAQVFKAVLNNQVVAVKKLLLDRVSIGSQESELRQFFQEIQLLSGGSHPNLLGIIGIIVNPPCLILPFAEHGSLYNILQTSPNYNWPFALRVAFDIANGMNYLHALDPPILHCDLRSPNILIYSFNHQDDFVAKVADFGLSQYGFGRILIRNKRSLNPRWTAPEVLKEEDISKYSDMYSFGCILFELLTRDIPFNPELNARWKFLHTLEDDVIKGVRPPLYQSKVLELFGQEIPNKIWEILEACWHERPSKRSEFRIILPTLKILLSPHWKKVDEVIVNARLNLPTNASSPVFGGSSFVENSSWKINEYTSLKQIHKQDPIDKFKNVYTCQIEREKGLFAMKELSLVGVNRSEIIRQEFQNEIKSLKFMAEKGGHPNIIRFFGYYEDSQVLISVMERFDDSLNNVILRKKRNPFSPQKTLFILTEIIKGLHFLHLNNFAHHNLKSDNILVKLSDITEIKHVVLTDFGTTVFFSNKNKYEKKKTVSSEIWAAPELLNKKEEEINPQFVDIWAFGIVLFEVSHGYLDKKPPTSSQIAPQWNCNFSKLKEIYTTCISKDPIFRPTIEELKTKILAINVNEN